MASSSGEGPKLVGAVVDPLALEPGESPNQPLRSAGHPVRDRLLEKARLTQLQGAEGTRPSGRDREDGAGGSIGLGVPKSQSRQGGQGRARQLAGKLSPTMTFIFSTLLGLVSVATLIAIAMNIDSGGLAMGSVSVADVPKAIVGPPVEPKGAVQKKERQRLPGPWRINDQKGDAGVKVVEGTVGIKAFLTAVQDQGLSRAESYRLLIAYKGLLDLDHCDKSDKFRALMDRASGKLRAFEYEVSAEEVYQARENDDGHLRAKKLDLKVARDQAKGALSYDGESFESSAKSAGFESGLAAVVRKALDGHLALEELERGDRLRLVVQEVTVLGEFARYAGVEALEILPHKGKPVRIYYFHHQKASGYYDKKGRAPYEGGWRKPVKGAPVTSKFNPNRLHPVLKKRMPHTGTDFGAPTGAVVGASSYGTVSFIGYAGASGNLVKVDHPGGIETGYAHLSRFAEGLKVGDRVRRLQVVGYVGSTGRSTGPHLHFSAKRDGKFFDAETLNLDGMRVLAKEYRSEFAEARERYDQLLNEIPLPAPVVVATPSVDPGATELDDFGDADYEEQESSASSGGSTPLARAVPDRPAEPAKVAKSGAGVLYLTDQELLEMQSATDEGEVDE